MAILTNCICFGQEMNSTETKDKINNPNQAKYGKVCFMRSTGFKGSAVPFNTFIDQQMVCRLNNKKFSVHNIEVGEHTFAVQFSGKTAKKEAETIKINIEEGKTYYIQLIYQTGFLYDNVLCQEVTENSAKVILTDCSEDTKCL